MYFLSPIYVRIIRLQGYVHHVWSFTFWLHLKDIKVYSLSYITTTKLWWYFYSCIFFNPAVLFISLDDQIIPGQLEVSKSMLNKITPIFLSFSVFRPYFHACEYLAQLAPLFNYVNEILVRQKDFETLYKHINLFPNALHNKM